MVIDDPHPQIGRIYDYVLGGTYNGEADRRAAEAMIARMPAYPRWARANRAFLSRAGERWAAEGRVRVLDLGSGLPTQGHLDTRLPDARILFSDVDAGNVAEGRRMLADRPGMAYVQADLRDPDALLAAAAAFFGAEREIAVGCIGVLYFLSDEHLGSLMAMLHDFCAPGSVMALAFPAQEEEVTDELRAVIDELSKASRIEFHPRTVDQVAAVIAPWRVTSAERIDAPLPDELRAASPVNRTAMFGLFAEHG